MASVKLYKEDELASVQGLYSQRALSKMDGNLEVYSTLLDKYLNEAPRTIPRIRTYLKDGKVFELVQELRDLRIDLADIFALGLLERANLMYDAAEKGDIAKCRQMQDPFISALQTLSYEIKQCRTQEFLENAEEAAQKASEIDIGASMVNNKYSTIPKAKFLELYKRINAGMLDKALNLANVLKAMGYDSEMSNHINRIIDDLNHFKQKSALNNSARLIKLLGGTVPEASTCKFTLLVVDNGNIADLVRGSLGDSSSVVQTHGVEDTLRAVKGGNSPDFILINKKLSSHDGLIIVEQLKRNKINDIPMGFLFTQPTSQDILDARKQGIQEFFILPLDVGIFAEKMKKYMTK